MTLSITKLCHYAEYHCAECRDLFIGMLNVFIITVIRLNVIMLSVVGLKVSFKRTIFQFNYMLRFCTLAVAIL